MNDFEIIDNYGCNFDYKYLEKIINRTLEMENVKDSTFSIVFIDDEYMHELNLKYRGIDRTTDVLSFAFEDNNKICYNIRQLGEIFVSRKKRISIFNSSWHSSFAWL